MQQLSGIWVPVVTPFAADGRVDHERLAALVAGLVADGIHGLVACGTTGEAATLDEAEQAAVLRTVLQAAGGRKVLMGVSGIAPREVAAACRRFGEQPVAGFLVPPPSYVRPSQQGIVEFYREVAAAAPSAIVVYDIPYRTGTEMSLATLRSIAAIPGVRGLKDCGGDPRKTQALIADGRLAVLSGEDHNIFTTLCQGGQGAIAASAHLHPRRFVEMYDAVQAGDLPLARRLHHALAPMVAALFAEPNPGPLKAQLAALGQVGPALRAPMTAASAPVAAALREAWQQAGVSLSG
ncbi:MULTISPECIES: 4-hydroxy-tetrahydrodipicolinate synthase [unclassified Rhizobacter]|uniref:4-hydroxy-tetrahydrodipicolinate synthase n=1 Tax=unclassified Rhizobacter TaxID=2640088 RepID=UPI0006F9CBAC|nr:MULTISPECIES: 4-hydroxy-tetrahydrodipicolinate synthase [unclassified Rhizobacter]KQU75970.1 4-hydroxy-tetrahydrodipicolinate synthase [Rhizobacter sp. Root29]KQW08775.1 4-hydroxy-tetrahydrodipicolinate synthase [Rhizobacter sp. Root1238]KRB16345.1 4-hydroxy-tetrahydrodipicolinate synthase [Rhizobacter sp. Root16D2]